MSSPRHNRIRSAGALATAACAALGLQAASALATTAGSGTYASNTPNITNVEQTYQSTGGTRITAEGGYAGNYANFGTMDFNGSTFGASTGGYSTTAVPNITNATGVPAGTSVTGVNSITVSLTDKDEGFATSGPVDIYLSTYNGSLTSDSNNTGNAQAAFQTTGSGGALSNGANDGIGNQLGTLTTGTLGSNNLVQLNSAPLTYTAGAANGGPGGTASAGFVYNYTFTPSAAVSSYITQQLNTFGNLRFVVAPNNNTVKADFQGSSGQTSGTPPLYAPQVSLNVNTTSATPTASELAVSPTTINLGRIVGSSVATSNVTVTNNGTGANSNLVFGAVGVAGGASGVVNGVVPTQTIQENLGAGGSTSVTVGMDASGIEPGSVSSASPVTATVNFSDHSNTSDSAVKTVTLSATQVVANRYVNNANGSSGVNFGNILIPNTGSLGFNQTVTLTTTNTIASTGVSGVADYTPNSLTTVELLGTTTINNKLLSSAPYGDTSTLSMAADPNGTNTIFGSTTNSSDPGTESATRQVTYTLPSTESVGGAYSDSGYYIGYASFALTQLDNAIGATANPTGRIYVIANLYQAASVSATGSQTTAGNNFGQMTNALHTVNTVYVNGAYTDIGLRDAAVVTAPGTINSTNTQNASSWSLDTGWTTNAQIGDGQTVNALDFNNTNHLNGTYQAELDGVSLENASSTGGGSPQPITGPTTNDVANNATFTLTTTVVGNTATIGGPAATAEILSGGKYAGYSITSSGTGSQGTNVSFLDGTASARNTIGVQYVATPTNSVVKSDVAAISGFNTNSSGQSGDNYVVQMSYNPSSITGSANSPTVGWYNGSIYQAANFGNSAGTATEYNGAYNPTATPAEAALGSYGINTATDQVWAVVNHTGNFAVEQRIAGDTTGKGSVSISDYGTVYDNVGITSGATWSQGDFAGTGNVTLSDLGTVYDNIGTTEAGTLSATVSRATSLLTAGPAVLTSSAPALSDVTLTVNKSTGDATLVFNNQSAQFNAWEITSTTGGLIYANLTDIASYGTGPHARGPDALDGIYNGAATGGYYVPGSSWDLGNIITPADITTGALDFSYNEINPSTGLVVTYDPATINYTSTPEPTTLALLALGGLPLIIRKRRAA